MNPFRRETSRWRCTTTRRQSSTKSWRSVALDESMRSMRETKLYQHYTIVTLGAAHGCNEFKSWKAPENACAAGHFAFPDLYPNLRDSCTTNSTSSDRIAWNTREVVDHPPSLR